MTLVAHPAQDTPGVAELADITTQIYTAIDRMALRVGELLNDALERVGFERWRAWVDAELPFGHETARRLRAVYLGCRELPADVLAQMPKPWQALYALVKIPPPQLAEAVASGTIHAGLSARQAIAVSKQLRGGTRHFSQLDVLAGRLLSASPDDLSADVAERLRLWLTAPRSTATDA